MMAADDVPNREPDEEELAVMVEYDKRVNACAQKIIECHKAVLKELDGDAYTAWEFFAAFAKSVKPRQKKGLHNPTFDAALLLAAQQPEGEKRNAAMRAAADKHAQYKMEDRSIRRRMNRLVAGRKRFESAIDEWINTNKRRS